MTLNLATFKKVIDNAAADQNILSVNDEVVTPGKKGEATLESVDLAFLLNIKDLKKGEKLTLGEYLQMPSSTSIQREILRDGNLVGYAVIDEDGQIRGSAPDEDDEQVSKIGVTLAQEE